MAEGAEAWCGAKPVPGPLIGAGAGGAAAVVVLLLDVVPALSAGELAALVGRGPGSKGGCSIMFATVSGVWLTVWGVINCRF
jgi:hypothetical protein